ncbi:hypothetical protein HRE53_33060 (plasmid) [Acaryochloris sp. 'Moss Beach']|uniref:hypothetical protein n=1 Tax=Acaryochloris sp. 'Moss Beach' TaxID=2740837 RepID=UPI001F1B2560|nr:hypothetical protein [Acaryochloris sp. 'Moss Beach']UJB73383.1 hypothetical protein HRE53_33060 [Acaryochloris sp. 'Moss Beach']
MKYRLLLPLALMVAFVPVSARADVNSCLQKLVKERIVFSPWAFTGGDHVAKTEYDGAMYHLIYLTDEVGRETTVVIRENASVCEAAYYNPTGGGQEPEEVLPPSVLQKFLPVAAARNKIREKKELELQREIAEEFKNRNR